MLMARDIHAVEFFLDINTTFEIKIYYNLQHCL